VLRYVLPPGAKTGLSCKISSSACHMYVVHADTGVLLVWLLRWLHGLSNYSSSAIPVGVHSVFQRRIPE